MATSLFWDAVMGGFKGSVKRPPMQETALRVRMMRGRHIQDVYDKLVDELGQEVVDKQGPLDMSRNPLQTWARRTGKAYLGPIPFLTGPGGQLDERLAELIGGQVASTTVQRYAAAGGTPMPTYMLTVSAKALAYRIACNYAGVKVGYSKRAKRPFMEMVYPDDLHVTYASDDPFEPTVIQHRLERTWRGRQVETIDVYDLTDLENPVYKTLDGNGNDITEGLHGETYSGDAYWWRMDDGTPFHRIVISGDPREPYLNVEIVELVLKICMFYSYFGANLRDAGHPQRNVAGLKLVGADSKTSPDGGGSGTSGQAAGPTRVVQWRYTDDERRAEHWQDDPGQDSEMMFRSIQAYEQAPIATALGLPLDFSRSGGEPSEQERLALEEQIRAEYPECRRSDMAAVERFAATANRAAEDRNEKLGIPEKGYAALYREEVREALAKAEGTEESEITPGEEG